MQNYEENLTSQSSNHSQSTRPREYHQLIDENWLLRCENQKLRKMNELSEKKVAALLSQNPHFSPNGLKAVAKTLAILVANHEHLAIALQLCKAIDDNYEENTVS